MAAALRFDKKGKLFYNDLDYVSRLDSRARRSEESPGFTGQDAG